MDSWKQHANALVDAGSARQVGIYGQEGVCWGATDGFDVTQAQARELAVAIDSNDAHASLSGGTIKLGAEVYSFLRSEKGSFIYGKKGPGGCCIYKTTRAIVVATFESPISATDCNCAVGNLADYLISMQY